MNDSVGRRVRFHLAIPVSDLDAAEVFYGGLLGCPTGRRDTRWIDFDFFDHQLVIHLDPAPSTHGTNPVDGENVPVRHFGVLLDRDTWQKLADRLSAENADFLIEPTLRHRGAPGEQAVFFIADPSGNALEFKSMTHPENVFVA